MSLLRKALRSNFLFNVFRQSSQLRSQELEYFSLVDKNRELEAKAQELNQEFEFTTKLVISDSGKSDKVSLAESSASISNIERQQDDLLRTLDALENKIDECSHKKMFSNDTFDYSHDRNVRSEISQKAVSVNKGLDQIQVVIQRINNDLNGRDGDVKGDNSKSSKYNYLDCNRR